MSGNHSFVPSAYTEDFCSMFMEDVFRLFQEEQVTIIYKPKRDWSSSNHPCPHRIAKIIRQVQGDGRWVTMPHNSNPWIPVLLSDLVIAIPFTSIYEAAIARRTPFLFHNPGRHIRYHVYGEFDGQTTNSYEELLQSARNSLVGLEGRRRDVVRTDIDQRLVDFLRDPGSMSARQPSPVPVLSQAK